MRIGTHQHSAHYSSTPILTQGGINPDIWSPGEKCEKNTRDENQFHGQTESQNASISQWVEQASRLSRHSSSSMISGSCTSSAEYEQCLFPVSTPNLISPTNITGSSLTPEEVSLIRSTYSSYKTTCYISSSLVNLYTSTTSSPWALRYTGVPTLLLNCGGSRARTPRSVHMILAERGTGFALWRDRLDNLSCYTADEEDKIFHSLHYSRDHRVRVGLSWDQEEAAALFLARVEDLTSRPDNLGLSGPKTRLRVPGRSKTKLEKVDISRPCGFRHNVSISMEDRHTFFSMMVNMNRQNDATYSKLK